MLELKKIQLEDKIWIDEILSDCPFYGCEYTFGNNFAWRDFYEIKICYYKGFYQMKNKYGFVFPAGKGDLRELIEELELYCRENGFPLVFSTAPAKKAELIKDMYGERVRITPLRDAFDYVYNYSDLADLRGKKYHSKRNYINRFSEYDWTYEVLGSDNIPECMKMLEEWRCENESGADPEKDAEADAARTELENYSALGFIGGLLRVDGKIAAFTFGEKRTENCFVVHVEKALRRYEGAYTMINREFVRHLPSQYIYINREDDAGAENLRKAKLSYHPTFMEEKFKVEFIYTHK